MKLSFPKGFLWGTSSAAAQIETAFEHQWKGVKAKDGNVFERTTDHEKRRVEDAAHIVRFGTVYRCGVDWSRLQSAAFAPFDEAVVKEYQAFFQTLIDKNMQIMFVLHHFAHPIWFEKMGAFTTDKTKKAFLHYVTECVRHFGSYTSYWNTFNEPNVYAINGYVLGAFPPFKKNALFAASTVLKNMGKFSAEASAIIRNHYPDKQIGISQNTVFFEGTNFLGKMVAKFADGWFIDFSVKQFIQHIDFLGISYYAHIPLTPTAVTYIDTPEKLEKMGLPHDKMWAYYPEGLRIILKRLYSEYKKPIIITENGVCTTDDQVRISSIKDYLKIIHELIQEGMPIKGYIHWSTWDNFEWNLGNTYCFGLMRVDFKTMNRQMTHAAEFYEKITRENELTI